MPRFLLAVILAGGLTAGPFIPSAAAVSVDELFNLKANGLSDEILVALIESDGSVFHLTPEDVLDLHKRGLSEKVVLAMLATSRRSAPQAAPVVPVASAPVIVERVVVQETAAPGAPPPQSVVQHVEVTQGFPVYVPIAVPVVPVRPEKPAPPEYWGFGGKLRPGSWKPAPEPDHRRGR